MAKILLRHVASFNRDELLTSEFLDLEIGRASCRERVFRAV